MLDQEYSGYIRVSYTGLLALCQGYQAYSGGKWGDIRGVKVMVEVSGLYEGYSGK